MRIAIKPTNTDGYHGHSTYPLVVDVDYIDLLDVQSNFEFISIPRTEYNEDYDIITEVRDYPKDYGKDFITYSLKPTPVVTLYCDSVSWDGKESTHDNNGTGSKEHPFRNLRNAINKAQCLVEQLCCIKVRIIVTGVFNYFVGEGYDSSGLDCTDIIIDFTQCDIQPILTENYLQHYGSRLLDVYIIGADVSNCTPDKIPFSTAGKSICDSCIIPDTGSYSILHGVVYNSTTCDCIDMDIYAIHDEIGLQHLTKELHWVGTYIKCDITPKYGAWCGVILDCNIFIKKTHDILHYEDISCMFICGSHIYSEYDSVAIAYIYNDDTPGNQYEAVANTMYNTEIHADTINMKGVFMHLSGKYTTLAGHLYYSNVSVKNIFGCVYDCSIECTGVRFGDIGLTPSPSISLASCVNSTINLSNELSWWRDGSIQSLYHKIRYLKNSNLMCDISFKKVETDSIGYYRIRGGFTVISNCEYAIDSNITVDFTLSDRKGDNDRRGIEYISVVALNVDTAIKCSGIINANVSSSGFPNDAHESAFNEFYCGIRANTYSDCTSTSVCRSTATKYCYNGECDPYILDCIENCIK